MNNSTSNIIKNILKGIIFITISVISMLIFISFKDNKQITKIKEFIKNDTKVLYISNEIKYSDYPIELFQKYNIDYLYIDSTKLNNFEKNKIEKIINSKYLSSIIIVYKNGEIVDAIIDYETEENLNVFLQSVNVIPQVIGDITGIIESVEKSLDSDLSLIYIPYKHFDGIEEQSKILKEISEDYGAEYKMINAYLLSSNQQEKLNAILQISSVEDQIIILIKNKNIVGSIRGINRESEYLEKLYEYEFVNKNVKNIKYIDYGQFNELLNFSEKSIIVFGKENCKYCEQVILILDSININYEILINYMDIDTLDSEILEKLKNKLIELGIDGFEVPLTILVESNKLLDYIVGCSDEKYFVEIFTKNGIIK